MAEIARRALAIMAVPTSMSRSWSIGNDTADRKANTTALSRRPDGNRVRRFNAGRGNA